MPVHMQALEEARELITGGSSSLVRLWLSLGNKPFFVARAKGAYVWDIDGNKCGCLCQLSASGAHACQSMSKSLHVRLWLTLRTKPCFTVLAKGAYVWAIAGVQCPARPPGCADAGQQYCLPAYLKQLYSGQPALPHGTVPRGNTCGPLTATSAPIRAMTRKHASLSACSLVWHAWCKMAQLFSTHCTRGQAQARAWLALSDTWTAPWRWGCNFQGTPNVSKSRTGS